MKICPEKIRLLVAENETTLAELAAKCDLAPSSVTLLLRTGSTRSRTAGKLAHALGVHVADIVAAAAGG